MRPEIVLGVRPDFESRCQGLKRTGKGPLKQRDGHVRDGRRVLATLILCAAAGSVTGAAFAQSPDTTSPAPFTPEWARAQELSAIAARRASPTPEAPLPQAAVPARQTAGARNATSRLNGAAPAPAPSPLAAGAALYDARPTATTYAIAEEPRAAFGPRVDFLDDTRPVERIEGRRLGEIAAIERRDIWREGDGHTDRLRLTTRGGLRRADGAPVLPTALDSAAFDIDSYDVSYTRGWEAARGYTASGLEVTLTPHAGVGVGDSGGTAEAGATLRIGSGMDNVAPKGSERFGDRARWYVYAAGSGRAVGYNFARTRDGDYARSGMSHDSGSFLGDASIGVAYRKGDMQGSFGVVYREIEAEGLRGGEGFDRDVSEGLVAFQLSIKPNH